MFNKEKPKHLWTEIILSEKDEKVRKPMKNSKCSYCERLIMSDYMAVDLYYNSYCSKDCLLQQSLTLSWKKDNMFEHFKTLIIMLCFSLQMTALFLSGSMFLRICMMLLSLVFLFLSILLSLHVTHTNYPKNKKSRSIEND